MPHSRTWLFVLADGEHARFLRPDRHRALHQERAVDSAAAHKHSAELGADRPGATYHSGSTAHHSFAPRHDPHELEKQRFAEAVAAEINAAAAAGGFEKLVLVAPAHALAALEAALDPTATACLAGTLTKDLVKTPLADLPPHLTEWLHRL